MKKYPINYLHAFKALSQQKQADVTGDIKKVEHQVGHWNIIDMLNSLNRGFPEMGIKGVALDTSGSMKVSDMMMCYGGSSARGSSKIRSSIRGMAHLGFLTIFPGRRGAEYVSFTPKGLAYLNAFGS